MSQSAPTIRLDQLGKSYRIDHHERSDTLRDQLTRGLRGVFRAWRKDRTTHENFWALRNISGEFFAGDVVGIVGRNGAGKSTLLKLLSRITEPTEGRMEIRGRLASLLEVGTGFHPELSGRENIFLNGAILGMAHQEIRRKFDEIVAFAEVERFLDTPVKRYSSGMYVRLAFAVAAHLEPEILIVDEVLAVGDAQFQQKCLGKMRQVAAGEGRTVLFVSHNLDSVARLCNRGFLLSGGNLVLDAPVEAVLAKYQNESDAQLTPNLRFELPAPSGESTRPPRFTALTLKNLSRPDGRIIATGDSLVAELEIESDRPLTVTNLAISLLHPSTMPLLNADSEKAGVSIHLTPGLNRVRLGIGPLHLAPGQYPVHLWLANTRAREYFDSVTQGLMLHVAEKPGATGLRPDHDAVWDPPFTVEQS